MNAVVIRGIPPEYWKREALEEHVERMISLLDMLDGDMDLEAVNEDGDPPWTTARPTRPTMNQPSDGTRPGACPAVPTGRTRHWSRA